MFAERYISRNIVYPEFIDLKPEPDLGMTVVVPCYREPDILGTLESLVACTPPNDSVEVIVVVNHPENDTPENMELNRKTFRQLEEWRLHAEHMWLRFFPVFPDPFPRKLAGAGIARKTGMDEAVRRFHALGRRDGIIVSLDADTTVDPSYFTEIEKFFRLNPRHAGATISFQHRTDRGTMSEMQVEGIRLYEKYLHYYHDALAFTGYPFALFTIGSAFCCTVEAYVKQGGMNRRKAGEDFYFLHKLSQFGPIGEITSTCVYPSARLSDRVPFGTGPMLQRWLDGREDLTLTFNFQAFCDLKIFFSQIDRLCKSNAKEYPGLLKELPLPIQQFLKEDDFLEELEIINRHCASDSAFRKRFFQVFNAFKVLKFINYSHPKFYCEQDITEAVNTLSLCKYDA
ncbi:MAG: glycosyltransferase [Prolixibacteraceae bacterium]|jgi:glycosyltransferase involved in cell wall biosynthesis|nr:glycosyltransferase [Prolixibacteraceae bacterium]